MQKYVYTQEKHWYKYLKKFLSGKMLKIGSGLGFMTTFIRQDNPDLTVLEIENNPKDANNDIVILYNGREIPFPDETFDCVVCTYVLHHTDNPILILSEMKRVAKRLIILEEIYDSLWSKLDLVYRDIYVNYLSGQPSGIKWNSYFKNGDLQDIFKLAGFKTVLHRVESKRSYKKELYVLENR